MWMYIIHRGTLGKERTVKEGMGKQWENWNTMGREQRRQK